MTTTLKHPKPVDRRPTGGSPRTLAATLATTPSKTLDTEVDDIEVDDIETGPPVSLDDRAAGSPELALDLDRLETAARIERDRQREEALRRLQELARFD